MPLFIPVIAGTTRPKRQSIHVARFLTSELEAREDITTELVDPREYDLSDDGNDPENKIDYYTELVKRADGFFVVVPEYNHGYPGSLKSMMDKELRAYWHKPVAFAGASSSSFGGVRAIEAMVPVVREMGLVAASIDVIVPKVQDAFDNEGQPVRDDMSEHADKAIEELLWLARTLKAGRDADNS